MKIIFDKLTLADSVGGLPVQNLEVEGRRMVDVEEGPEWEEVQLFDRQNRSKAVSFSTERQHASESAAEVYAFEHDEEVPVKATLQIIGLGQRDKRFLNAACVRVQSRAQGCRTFTRYEFVTGMVSNQRSGL